ncbi:hypothetical protein ACIBU0_03085 [Streptomyces sp. NPDC049627]|uniref:hypothetical protein n=1 Tax=Streptomyces sp. NPDC049627 TaxID=3365595 RepID=UPI0037ABAE73
MATVRLVQNIGLDDQATSKQTSTITETTVATSNSDIFVTGNWFASRSGTVGKQWELVNPFTALPSAAGGFCCDQIVMFEPSRRIWIWILQYIAADDPQQPGVFNNVFRVAVSHNTDPSTFHWWDFAPISLNPDWRNMWFDYPDAATSANHLYVTFNAFNRGGSWQRAFVFKFPLDALEAGNALSHQWWSTTERGSLRLTQGAAGSMFFASHNGGTGLRVHGWPDSSNTVGWFDVQVSPWNANNYRSVGPDGKDWLAERVDSRITGAWVSGTRAGFLWTAASRSGRPMPYVKGAVVDVTTQTLVEQPEIWNEESAYAFPAACPNAQGVVGLSLFMGGGPLHPSHLVGFRDGADWRLVFTRKSTQGPDRGTWGDYLTCHRHDPDASEWVTSGYTLQGGGDREFVEPQYVHFGIGS